MTLINQHDLITSHLTQEDTCKTIVYTLCCTDFVCNLAHIKLSFSFTYFFFEKMKKNEKDILFQKYFDCTANFEQAVN